LTRVYRLLRAPYASHPFNGEGAFRFGGRWSSPGTRIVYSSDHQSLALLEYFVHLTPSDSPADLVLATADVPDALTDRVGIGSLPPNWRQSPAPAALARIGDEFIRRGQNVALLVPSALATTDYNWLLNPQHSEFRRIVVHPVTPFRYDQRLIAGKSTHPVPAKIRLLKPEKQGKSLPCGAFCPLLSSI